MRKYASIVLFSSMLLIGALLRFSYLDWGKPFFFHPDENNITNAILQLSFSSWNPHFFAYGGLPIYVAFLFSQLVGWGQPTYATITYSLRFISASFSFFLLPSLWYVGKKLFHEKVGWYAAAAASVGIGFIQFGHFGTFEMWLTFLTLWLFYLSFLSYKNPTRKHIFFASLVTGLLLSVKVSSIIFLPLVPGILLLKRKQNRFILFNFLQYVVLVSCIYFATNPYLFLDTQSFIQGLHYESSVALGSLPVFYTQTFLHTIPVIFQLQHIFPFLLNPFIFLFFCISIIAFFITLKKRKNASHIFLLLFFVLTFFSQAFLFVKWTRYIVPTLPFAYFFIAIFLTQIQKRLQPFFVYALYTASLLLAIIFVMQTYSIDSRIQARVYAQQHFALFPAIVEPYDLGTMPFQSIFPKSSIVNVYELENSSMARQQLNNLLRTSNIFLSPSQRLIRARLQNVHDFPEGNALYVQLLNGSVGFHIAYQTPCDTWCHLIYSGNPMQGSVEETATVFDHPFVTIFAKK